MNKPIGLLQDTHFVHTKYHLVKGETPKTPFQQTTASAKNLMSMMLTGI